MKSYSFRQIRVIPAVAILLVVGHFSCKEKPSVPQGEVAAVETLKSNIRAAQEAFKKDSDDSKARMNLVIFHKQLSQVYENQGRLEDAILEEKKAQKIEPENQNTRFRLGELYSKKGDYLRAAHEFETLAQDNPLYSALLYIYLGDVNLKLNKMEKARAAYYKALDINPFSVSTYGKLADINRQEGKVSEAQIQDQIAEQIRNWGFVDRGFKEKSLEEWEQILKQDPFNPLALYNVACYYDLNMDPASYESIKKALMAWNRYLEGTRGQTARHNSHRARGEMADQDRHGMKEKDRYHKGIQRHIQELKRKKGKLARELGIVKLEELQGYIKTTIANLDLLEWMMRDAEVLAAESGKPDLQSRAETLRERVDAIGVHEFREKLSAVLGKIKGTIQKRIISMDSVPEKELHLSYSNYLREYQAISEELQAKEIIKLELDVRRLAADLGMKGYRPMRHFDDFPVRGERRDSE
jgi:predicted negative regulator of RcsB-dependent stress response/ribosomal protein S13